MNRKTEKENLNIMIITNAADLWIAMNKKAGLQTSFYDKALVNGDESSDGLYQALNIEKKLTFAEDLRYNKVTIEEFIIALFKVLQPYGEMMNDLCVFFEKYKIQKEDKTLQIEYDFETEDNLNFNLENFREISAKLHVLESSILNVNHHFIWDLNGILTDGLHGKKSKNQIIQNWIFEYRENKCLEKLTLSLPKTSNDKLDNQLELCMKIWESFIAACLTINTDYREVLIHVCMTADSKDQQSVYFNSWTDKSICSGLRDYWPEFFLNAVFCKIEQLNDLSDGEKKMAIEDFSDKLNNFLDSIPIITNAENRFVNQLVDLLNLPIWDKRHELYSVWVLTIIERAFDGYPLKVHHTDGVLKIPFKPKKLLTAYTIEGEVIVISEARTKVENLNSGKRKNYVQPDYVIFKCEEKSDRALAVIEVKQYKVPGKANFEAAIKDYSIAFQHADVFLVNYGKMSNLVKLYDDARNNAIGAVYPKSENQKCFLNKLKKTLPIPLFVSSVPSELYLYVASNPIEYLFIDISSSMRGYDFDSKTLRNILKLILTCQNVDFMIAVDKTERKTWGSPTIDNIDELLGLEMGSSTGFNHLLPNYVSAGLVIITDPDGRDLIEDYQENPFLLIVIDNSETFIYFIEHN